MDTRLMIVAYFLSASLAVEAMSDEAAQIEQLRKSIKQKVDKGQEKIDQGFQKLADDLGSSDPAVRARAIQSILATKDGRLIPVIAALLEHPSAHTRHNAILALSRLRAKGLADKVGALISDPKPEVRHAAAEYGTHLGYKSTLKEVKGFVEAADSTSHSMAMHLTRSLPDKQAVPVLAEFLHHKSHHLRKRAVWRLTKYDRKLIRPHAVEILKLAGDSDSWVRSAVSQEKDTLLGLVTKEDLRKLTQNKSGKVQALAFGMLSKKGVDVAKEMTANLSAEDPALRLAALEIFMSAKQGPEKEIVALLDDPDSYVKAYALYAVRQLQLRSSIPKLREIFAADDRSHSRNAARALVGMSVSVWAPTKAPKTAGPVYDAAARLASGDATPWPDLLRRTDGLVTGLSKLDGFPCDRAKMVAAADAKDYAIIKNATGGVEKRRCLGARNLASVRDSVVIQHGNLTVNGVIIHSVLIVTGDLYLHEGYIYHSIVLVQGKIICNGYINNSVVAAGEKETLTVSEGYVWGSIATAGQIACRGYLKDSLFAGTLKGRTRYENDLRNSKEIDSEAVYRHLQQQKANKEK